MPMGSKSNSDKKYIVFQKSDIENKDPSKILSMYYGPQLNIESKLAINKDQSLNTRQESQELSSIIADCTRPEFQKAYNHSYSSMISYLKEFELYDDQFVICSVTNLMQKSPNWDNVCDLPEGEIIDRPKYSQGFPKCYGEAIYKIILVSGARCDANVNSSREFTEGLDWRLVKREDRIKYGSPVESFNVVAWKDPDKVQE